MQQTVCEKMRPCFWELEHVYGHQRHFSEASQKSSSSWSFHLASLSYHPAHETPKSKYEVLIRNEDVYFNSTEMGHRSLPYLMAGSQKKENIINLSNGPMKS